METTYASLRKAMKNGETVLIDHNQLVYDTIDKDLIFKCFNEPFADAICRYMDFSNIGTNDLAAITGISASAISRYRSGKKAVERDHLCAICIALKLSFRQQQHLFTIAKLKMPCDILFNKRDDIINSVMLQCSCNDKFTIDFCNKLLKENGERQLTAFSSEVESS